MSAAGLTPIPVHPCDLKTRLAGAIERGNRLGLLTARRLAGEGRFALLALVVDPAGHSVEVWETALDPGSNRYESVTTAVPGAHWFERAILDMFGLQAEGHPHFKGLLLHEAWPAGFYPHAEPDSTPAPDAPARVFKFQKVRGEGVYEIPVGPIHAGIIEPGHFRFSCLGEVIQNLEIRLGYLHRGVERRITQVPWRQARFVAEAASTDTAVGNALAHALAIEQIQDCRPTVAARDLRAVALEIERIATHIGDLGGICSDIGYAGGAATFQRLRGQALGMGERLSGARFMTAYVLPGGVSHAPSAGIIQAILSETRSLQAAFAQAEPLLLNNAAALERMERTGDVRASLARDFGLVGPAGRASGIEYDVRAALAQEPYASLGWQPAVEQSGDVLARVRIRAAETRASLEIVAALLAGIDPAAEVRCELPGELAPNRVGVGMVEAWRGELVHLAITGPDGTIERYAIKDPSLNNWTGLIIAARSELVPDFPLCNKSFGLSYSGNDL